MNISAFENVLDMAMKWWQHRLDKDVEKSTLESETIYKKSRIGLIHMGKSRAIRKCFKH